MDGQIIHRTGGFSTVANSGVYVNGGYKRVNSCFAISIRDALIRAGNDQIMVNDVTEGIVRKLDEYFGKDAVVNTDCLTIEKATSWNNIITQILNIFGLETCLVHRTLPNGRIRVSEYGVRDNKDPSGIIEIWANGLHFEAIVR
jgi:hypothetical protein